MFSTGKPSIMSPNFVQQIQNNPSLAMSETSKSIAKQLFVGISVVIVGILTIAFFTKPR